MSCAHPHLYSGSLFTPSVPISLVFSLICILGLHLYAFYIYICIFYFSFQFTIAIYLLVLFCGLCDRPSLAGRP